MVTTTARITVEWLVPNGQANALTRALHRMAADIRCAHSSISCSVSNDAGGCLVRYVEEWPSTDALRRRMWSPGFRQLARLMKY
jgi:hypothetical protein